MHFAPILALAGFAAATVTTPVATPIATRKTPPYSYSQHSLIRNTN